MISPHIVRKNSNPSSPPAEAGIHWINTVTNEEFFSVGTTSINDWIPRRRSGFICYFIVLTSADINNKYIILPLTPVDSNNVIVTPVGGITQLNGIDYDVNSNIISWDLLGLDGFLEENDVLIIQH